jgi:hypothetical protein
VAGQINPLRGQRSFLTANKRSKDDQTLSVQTRMGTAQSQSILYERRDLFLMAGLPYEAINGALPFKAPKKKLPYI